MPERKTCSVLSAVSAERSVGWIVSHTDVSIDIASYAPLLCNVRGDTVLKCILWYSWLGLLSGVRNDEGNLTEMVCVGRARTEPLV